MEGLKIFSNLLLIFTIHCLISHCVNTTTINDVSVSKNNNFEELSEVGWVFHNESLLKRSRRTVIQSSNTNNKLEKNHNLFEEPLCRGDLRRLCGNIDSHNDDMQLWECIQSLKVCFYLLFISLFICLFILDN